MKPNLVSYNIIMDTSNLSSKIEEKLLPIANKISSQRHLKAIRDGFLSILPLTLAGGIASVIGAAPITENTTNGFLLAWANFAEQNSFILSWINTATMGAMSFYLCIAIAYYLAKHYKYDPFHPILVSMCGFITLVIVPKELGFAGSIAEIGYIGGRGIVPAIIIAILTVELYHLMRKRDFGKIKMPPSVPEVITTTFGILIPCLIITFIYIVVFVIFHKMNTSLVEAMYSALQPAFQASDNLIFTILITIITNFLFFFGIHDTAIAGFVGPIRESNLAINSSAKLAGEALPHIFTTPFWTYFVIIGGVGCTLALGLLLLNAKSKICKYVGRIGVIPSFFGINEPIVFGLPVVFNPLFFIPFMLAPLVNAIAAYILMSKGILGRTFAMVSWNMPNIFGVFLSTMDKKTIIFSIVCTIVDALIYYPFFKVYDNQQYRLEQEAENK